MRAPFPVPLFDCLGRNRVNVAKTVAVQHSCHGPTVLGRKECSFGNLVVAPGEEGANTDLFTTTAPAGAGGNQSRVL